MPLPPSGDTGEGHDDDPTDDPTDDSVEFRPPLPPEDRIWRHPSEVAATATRAAAPPTTGSGRNTLALVVAAGLIGATLSIGVVAALGGFETRTRVVERQVAIQPVTSQGTDGIHAITERTSPSVAGVYVAADGATRTGSAVVIRSDGYLLTTAGLVDGGESVDVRIPGRPMAVAEVVGVDLATDLAVLRVDADDLEPAAMGSAEGVRAGHDAIVIGHNDHADAHTSVDRTVVSALDRRLQSGDGTVLYGMILLDDVPAAAAHGGPLLDRTGAVIGIARGLPAVGEEPDGWRGVATPIDLAVRAADQIIEHGHVRRVWLGIEGADLDATTAATMALPGGAQVRDVTVGSPAASAGIEAGDVVVDVGGATVTSMAELIAELRRHEPGDEVAIGLRRGDDTIEVVVTLAERVD